MPSFKPKATKKIKVCKRYSTTLDGKHKEIMTDFSKDEYDIIPKLKEEKAQLIQQITDQNSDLSIEQAMEIKDRLKEIKNTINDSFIGALELDSIKSEETDEDYKEFAEE